MLKYLFLYSDKETSKDTAANKTECAFRTAFSKKNKNYKYIFL